MKQFPPIVLFFMLFISCDHQENVAALQDPIAKNILRYIDRSKTEASNQKRLKYSNLAYKEAEASKRDSLLYKALYNKIEADITFQQNGSSDFYLENLKAISKEESRQAGYFYLKAVHFLSINLDSSFVNYDKSQRIYSSLKGHEQNAGYNLFMMAEIARTSADYANAENILTEAYHYLKAFKKYDSSIHNSFGLLYHSQRDYDKALYYYKKTLDIATDPEQKNVIINNIALVHTDKKEYGKSVRLLDSLTSSPALELNPGMKAKVFSNLGYAIFLSGRGDGIPYMKRASKLQDSIGDSFGSLANYLKLSEAYLEQHETLSQEYALKAYRLARQLHNGDDRLRALELMAKGTGSRQETHAIISEYITLNDSINTARQMAKNQFAKIRYDSSEATKQALLAKAESAESRLQVARTQGRNSMLLVLVLFLIVGIAFWYRFMKKKNTIEKLKASYAAETRISIKVHDELANDVYNVMNFTNSQDISIAAQKERLMNDLDSLYRRTRDISKENSTIETGAHFASQLKEMLSEYQNENVNIASRGIDDINWTKIENVKKISIYRVLQELMVNMAKHSEAAFVLVGFRTKGRNAAIEYFDNGIGIPSDKLIFRNGLSNAENRIEAIGGRLTFEPVPQMGLKIKIVFPI